MFVVDASVACKYLLNEPGTERAGAVLLGDAPLSAPHFFFLEVAQVLWSAVRRKRIAASARERNLEAAESFGIEIHADAELLRPAFDISARCDIAVYDALYVALGVRERATLVTSDDALCVKLRRARIVGFKYELI